MGGVFFRRVVDPPRLRAFLRRLRTAELRQALRLCIPALVLATLIRAAILFYMPAAFVHNDTASTIETSDILVHRAALSIEGKKTFLVPLVYCLPALLHIPILPFAAIVQHLLGIVAGLIGGLLTYAWFKHWRWLIVPVTLLLAIQPVMLWYEHAALAESWAIFGILAVALASTAFSRFPNRYTFPALLLSLLFIAGARPEGRLFSLFALVLVARVLWGQWRMFLPGVSITAAWTTLIFLLTRTGQGGLLLFTSLLQLSPPHLWLSPGVAEAVAPLSTKAREEWSDGINAPKLVSLRKALQERLIEFQVSNGVAKGPARDAVNKISSRAGMEIALRNALALPELGLAKFVIAHREFPAPDFNEYAASGQLDCLYDNDENEKALDLSPLMWGREFHSPDEARNFFTETYRPIPWDFPAALQRVWVNATLAPALTLQLPGSAIKDVPVRGVPWLYLAGFLGLLALAIRDIPRLGFHVLWGGFLVGLFVLIMVTANIRARFRILFEPFWILYAFALLDSILIFAGYVRHRMKGEA